MSYALEQILKKNFVDSQDTVWHTHVSMVNPRGKFQFNRLGLEDFWSVYCDALESNTELIIGVAEKPQSYTPVLVDIDLKIKEDIVEIEGDHLYSEKHVMNMIQIYQSVLREIVDGCNDDNLTCILLEKPIYYITTGETRYVKNGFHLHFPGIFLSKIDQMNHLFPRIKKAVGEMKLFADLGIEDSKTVVDECTCTVPWLMYGSRKSEDSQPYILTKVFDSNCCEIDLETAFGEYCIFNNEEEIIDIRGSVKHYIPRIMSTVPYGRDIQELKDGLPYLHKEQKKSSSIRSYESASVSAEESLKISAQLLPLLADFRADDRNEWMGIGWVLFNIGGGCSDALDQWLDFSSRSTAYDEGRCIYEWGRMTKKDKTIGTLKHYAKYDNPEKYAEFIKNQADPLIRDALNGSHTDIANILYTYYGDEFRCSSVANQTWYQFKPEKHRWEEIENGVFLRKRISDQIVADFVSINKKLCEEMNTAADKPQCAAIAVRQQLVNRLIMNLKSAPFKNNVMKEAQDIFYDITFREKLDQNPYLFGFKNGIYDLKQNVFRPGIIDDYISVTAPIEYQEYNESDNAVQDVKEFLSKVFPDSSIRTYFLDVYSDIFVGGNTQKKVYMWTGEGGDNAKSITQCFFEMMLGPMAIKFNTQYFTGKKTQTGSANPELARAAPPVRHATMEEPDADEQLNIGELKKLSGGDSYWARDLFQKGKETREVFPMFSLTFICNRLPKLRHSDKATWNRLRVIPFESTFIPPGDPCPSTADEQFREKKFPMDRDFKAKLPGMVPAFAWYLLEWRKKLTVRIEPAKVKEATDLYRKQNDLHRQFVEERLIECDKFITVNDLYAEFKEWFKQSFPNTTLPIKNDVKDYFETMWGEAIRGVKWQGFRIRTLKDDEDSGDAVVFDESDYVDYTDTCGTSGCNILPL